MNTIGAFQINTQTYRDRDEELERWIDRYRIATGQQRDK